jgi:MraZ protein
VGNDGFFFGRAIMSRFRGRFDYSIDEKGRINIPFKFRNLLPPEAQGTFVISRAPDGCLWAYPLNEWEKYEDSLIAMPMTKGVNRFQREIQNTLSDSVLDKQGRVTLTPHQIEIAGIEKDVSIIGRGHYLEIWATERFEKYTGSGKDFDEVYYKTLKPGNRRG